VAQKSPPYFHRLWWHANSLTTQGVSEEHSDLWLEGQCVHEVDIKNASFTPISSSQRLVNISVLYGTVSFAAYLDNSRLQRPPDTKKDITHVSGHYSSSLIHTPVPLLERAVVITDSQKRDRWQRMLKKIVGPAGNNPLVLYSTRGFVLFHQFQASVKPKVLPQTSSFGTLLQGSVNSDRYLPIPCTCPKGPARPGKT
jgi:hypothetical protein